MAMCEWALKMPLPTQLSVSKNQLFKNGGEVIERGILTGFPPLEAWLIGTFVIQVVPVSLHAPSTTAGGKTQLY